MHAAMVNLFDRTWIRRVWVQQEVFAARDVVVLCGREMLTFAQYRAAAAYLLKQHTLKVPHMPTFEPQVVKNLTVLGQMRMGGRLLEAKLEVQRQQRDIREIYCTCFDDKRPPFQDLIPESTNIECILHLSQNLLATDVRDRIFALLSLSSCRLLKDASTHDLSTATFHVDYSSPPSVIFQNLTKYIINRDNNYNVLSLVMDVTAEDGLDSTLPSWCPDWRRFNHAASSKFQSPYDRRSFVPASHTDIGELIIPGHIMATIQKRSRPQEDDLEHNLKNDGVVLTRLDWGNNVQLHWTEEVITRAFGGDSNMDFRIRLNSDIRHLSLGNAEIGDVLVETSDLVRGYCIVLRPRPSGGFHFVPGSASRMVSAMYLPRDKATRFEVY